MTSGLVGASWIWPQKQRQQKLKKDSLDCIKIKSLYASKEHDQWNEKATPMDWKYLQIMYLIKFIARIHEEYMLLLLCVLSCSVMSNFLQPHGL